MALKAGRIMQQHLHDLAAAKEHFAFETTLASKTFAPWVAKLKAAGYQFHLVFLWLESADVAINRVKARVADGGHSIPEETIRRRYQRGIDNFFQLYRPLANCWSVYDHSDPKKSRLLAEKSDTIETVHDPVRWQQVLAGVKL